MDRSTQHEPIVVAVDGSPHSDAAVEWAAHESRLRGASVTLVHVVAPVPDTMADRVARSTVDGCPADDANTIVAASEATFLAVYGQPCDASLRTVVVESPIVAALVDASARARLVVVGSRGHRVLGRLLLGSVSAGLIHRAHCPVAVIPLDEHHGAAHATRAVVLGVDGTAACESAIAFAFDEAARRGADLLAVHAWSDVGVLPVIGSDRWYDRETSASELLAQCLAGWQEKYPDVRVIRRTVCDVPAHALLFESRCSQLVVVGNRGRGGFAGMHLGAVGCAVVHSSSVPVIVVRH
jgi:nucleotide-binding universal stress UspA family protein